MTAIIAIFAIINYGGAYSPAAIIFRYGGGGGRWLESTLSATIDSGEAGATELATRLDLFVADDGPWISRHGVLLAADHLPPAPYRNSF